MKKLSVEKWWIAVISVASFSQFATTLAPAFALCTVVGLFFLWRMDKTDKEDLI